MIPSAFAKDDCKTAADVWEKARQVQARRGSGVERQPVAAPAPVAPPPPPPPVMMRKPEPLPPVPVLLPPPPPLCTPIRSVIAVTAAHFGFTPQALVSDRRGANLVRARHVAMYIAHEHACASYPAIGRAMGGRDHSTIVHGASKIAEMLKAGDVETKEAIDKIIGRILQGPPFECVEVPDPPARRRFSPPDCPRKGQPWSDEENNHLLRLQRQGIPTKIIAHRLGRSPDSVKCQAIRLGHPFGRRPK